LHRMKALFDQSADVTEATVSVFSSIVAYNWNRCWWIWIGSRNWEEDVEQTQHQDSISSAWATLRCSIQICIQEANGYASNW
jgi:hypothetical protein